MSRVCPDCGTDTYKAQQFDKMRDRVHRVEAQNKKLAARNGVLFAQAELVELEGQERYRGLQSKVRRQGRVIRRLEDKLRALGQRPHEGVRPAETSPVAQGEASVIPGDA